MAAGSTQPGARPRAARRRLWGRPLLRALHRDGGHLVVGLTVVYALSGLAVNHIADWDPNYANYERTYELGAPLHGSDDAIAKQVLAALEIREQPSDVYRVEARGSARARDTDDATLEITLDKRSLHVAPATGRVLEQGQKSRFLLRAANYLHLNRGKRAWKYIADGYAVILLFLAGSGLFMIPNKNGLRGRGTLLTAIGIAIPVLYVTLS
jgi:hypothetical protein